MIYIANLSSQNFSLTISRAARHSTHSLLLVFFFPARLLAVFALPSPFDSSAVFDAASPLDDVRFARGAAAAPPRFRPLLSGRAAGLAVTGAVPLVPFCLAFRSGFASFESRSSWAEMTLFPISSPLRRRTYTSAVLCRSTIDVSGLYPKVVRIDCHVRLFGSFVCVSNSGAKALSDQIGCSLARILQYRQRSIYVLATNHIHDEARLLCDPLKYFALAIASILVLSSIVPVSSFELTHNPETKLEPGNYFGATFVAFSTFVPEWPLKVRVGANSPSLWPTMFSVT